MEFDKPVMVSELQKKDAGEVKESGTIFFRKAALPNLAYRFAQHIESAPSDQTCICGWMIHPDDSDIQPGCCRICGLQESSHTAEDPEVYSADVGPHEFKGRRKMLKEHNEMCPVHTKMGFLLGFIEWAVQNG